MGMAKTKPSELGPTELRGLAALEFAMRNGVPIQRRYALGMREETISTNAAYCLWGSGAEMQLFVRVDA